MDRTECESWAGSLLEYFYEQCPEDRFTDDAKQHLRRLAQYVVCYSFVTDGEKDPGWWEAEGEKYYRCRVRKLFAHWKPDCDGPEKIGMVEVQRAVNEYADSVGKAIRRFGTKQKADLLRERCDPPGESDDDGVIHIMGACPFMA